MQCLRRMLSPTDSGSAIFSRPIPHYVHVCCVTFCKDFTPYLPEEFFTWLSGSKCAFVGTELTINLANQRSHHLLNGAFDSIEKLKNSGQAEGPIWERAMRSTGCRNCSELRITLSKPVNVPELVKWLYEPLSTENSQPLRLRNLRLYELHNESAGQLTRVIIDLVKKVRSEIA